MEILTARYIGSSKQRDLTFHFLNWGEPTSSPLEQWIGKWQGRLSGFSWIQKPFVKFLPNHRNGINSGVCYFKVKNINQIPFWNQCGSIFSKKETIEAQLSSHLDPLQITLSRYVLCQENWLCWVVRKTFFFFKLWAELSPTGGWKTERLWLEWTPVWIRVMESRLTLTSDCLGGLAPFNGYQKNQLVLRNRN